MNKSDIAALILTVMGFLFLIPGLPGLTMGELTLSNKGRSVTYRGKKARVLGGGMVLGSVINLGAAALMGLHTVVVPDSQMGILLFVPVAVVIVAYVASVLVRE